MTYYFENGSEKGDFMHIRSRLDFKSNLHAFYRNGTNGSQPQKEKEKKKDLIGGRSFIFISSIFFVQR